MNETYILDRTKELQDLNNLVTNGVRLINITGEAGIGKTVLTQLFLEKYSASFSVVLQINNMYLIGSADLARKLEALDAEKCIVIIDLDPCDLGEIPWKRIVNTLKHKDNLTIFAVSRIPIEFQDDGCNIAQFKLNQLSRNQVLSYCANTLSIFLEDKHFDDFYKITQGSPLLIQLLTELIISDTKNSIKELVGFHSTEHDYAESYHPNNVPDSLLLFFLNNPENLKQLTQDELESIVASHYENDGYVVQTVGSLWNKRIHIYHSADIAGNAFLYIVDSNSDCVNKDLQFVIINHAFGVILSSSDDNEIYAIGELFDSQNKYWKQDSSFRYPISLETFRTIEALLNNQYDEHIDKEICL